MSLYFNDSKVIVTVNKSLPYKLVKIFYIRPYHIKKFKNGFIIIAN